MSKIKNDNLKFIDLFAGIGGFHLALHNLGAECVFASEWNEPARRTYEKNFKTIQPSLFEKGLFAKGQELFAGDITKVNSQDIPDFDILCGGFPCQPFSISGKQKGFQDTRGTLFFNVLEIIKAKKPKVVFLENVKHLKYHDNKKTLSTIIENLENIGYKTEWKILNAKDFGLAQNRERIIIVSHRDKRFDFSKVKKEKPKTIKDIMEKNAEFEYLKKIEYTILPKNKWKKQDSGLIFCGYRNKLIRTKGTRPNTEHLSRVHKQPNRIYFVGGTHPTIPSQESSGRFWIYDGKNVRKLTINECFQLQGFPSDFKKVSTNGVLYNQIGNAVAVPMVREVAREIINQLI